VKKNEKIYRGIRFRACCIFFLLNEIENLQFRLFKTISSEANESLPVHNQKTVNTYKHKREREQSSDWTDTKRNLGV
jgi:hypothetical protein